RYAYRKSIPQTYWYSIQGRNSLAHHTVNPTSDKPLRRIERFFFGVIRKFVSDNKRGKIKGEQEGEESEKKSNLWRWKSSNTSRGGASAPFVQGQSRPKSCSKVIQVLSACTI
ncbi:MAG: hypothetical protein E6662_17005, partial [Pantoea sp.]|nr:hypothetical protein [Pantoea sp.]